MLKSITTVMFVLTSCASTLAQGTLTLEAGQSWSYEFTSLPLLEAEPTIPGNGTAGGVHFTITGFEPSDHYTIQLFQDSLAGTPVWTTDSDVNSSASGGAILLWQDLQGWVRLNVLAGEIAISAVQFDVRIPIDSLSDNHYQAIVSVPEPGPLPLLALGMLGLTASHAFRHRVRPNSAHPLKSLPDPMRRF